MDAPSFSRRGRSLAVVLVLVVTTLLGLVVMAPQAAAAGPFYAHGSVCNGAPAATWATGDTWILNASAVVDAGCVLTIQAGVLVKADPGVSLYVEGSLIADGNSGDPIRFENNQTAATPWSGIQFNASSQGSVSWSDFTRVALAINATRSSPAISNNTILQAYAGVYLNRSSSRVADNLIDGKKLGSFGIVVQSSNATLERNRINGTNFGIRSFEGGNLSLADNTITNTSGSGFAMAIYLDNLTSASLRGNTIQRVLGRDAGPGGTGTTAVGILINDASDVTLAGNTIQEIRGGRGGDGAAVAIGPGSPGGAGGAAAGVALGSVGSAVLQGNTVRDLAGNQGGNGGSSSTGKGGPGGAGGVAFALELFSSAGNVSYLGNEVHNVTGGDGGAGAAGSSATANGPGGSGADAYAIFSAGGMNASISGSAITDLAGGRGGSSAGGNLLAGRGGSGGNATAAIAIVNGMVTIHANSVANLSGGLGGDALSLGGLGGFGGNATAIVAVGTSSSFNRTVVTYNQVSNVTGGTGGVGGKLSGSGGNASGITGLHINVSLTSNVVTLVQGGHGGAYGVITNQASGGGFAGGFILLEIPDGTSLRDTVRNVYPGTNGGGDKPPASYGVGFFFVGNDTVQTRATVTNGTISGANGFDLWVDNYTEVATLNTPFQASKVAVMPAGNLTVQNFLNVTALWPNGISTIWGARVAVTDNGIEFYNRTAQLGSASWIVVTNRVYHDSPIPRWNTTQVTVSYPTYGFANNPRIVNMTSSQTQSFTMIDTTAPTSSALSLPAWTSTRTFSVFFISGDGLGVGIENVTLWYRLNGTSWVAFGNQSLTLLGIGMFTFNAPSDGRYEFATTAVDNAGNLQQPTPPTANNTWTIVDTAAPASRVLPLPRYETSSSFTVSWAPDTGISDVSNYTVQANTGSGWSDWLTNTTATSGTYTATVQGPIAFRTLAHDFAGNDESKTANDTWTVVDTVAPQAVTSVPFGNLSASPSAIQVTFSEPMNESAVEIAFSLAPAVPGTFVWSNGSRTLRFQLSQPLGPGTTYTVVIDTRATDIAGNGLAQADVFTFATPAAPAPPGLSLGDLWPLFVIVAAALAALAFFLVRRRGAAEPEAVVEAPKAPLAAASPKQEAAIDDVFLLYRRDGVLIKHETRRLRPDIDTDILSGMLTAVQQFVKDSFHGDEGEELNEMTVGQMHILIGRGKWLVLAATLTGGDIVSMTAQIQKCVEDMETHNWDRLEDWDGDMELSKALGPYLKKLIRGEYAA